jgi:hypothetical protein
MYACEKWIEGYTINFVINNQIIQIWLSLKRICFLFSKHSKESIIIFLPTRRYDTGNIRGLKRRIVSEAN